MSVLGGVEDILIIDSVKVTVVERGKEEKIYYIPRQVAMVLGWDADGNFGAVAGGGGGGGTPYTSAPKQLGVAAAGASTLYAKGDHVHPTLLSRTAVANNSGNVTITPALEARIHKHEITVGGSAGARKVVLDIANRSTGDRVRVAFALPATAGITFTVHDATTGGTQIFDTATDGVATRRVVAEFEFNGTAWVREFAIDPA